MKKKSTVLDFTSLLDIIMIILFVVLANMNESSMEAIAKAEDVARVAQIQNEMLSAENDNLKENLINIQNDVTDHIAIYPSMIDKMTKVHLICETQTNQETNHPEVEIRIFVNDQDRAQKNQKDGFLIVHELGLTASERRILSANQVAELTKVLTSMLEQDDSPLIWFAVQYDYQDKNFTYSDLEILRSAVDNVEIGLSKPCYMEQINIG